MSEATGDGRSLPDALEDEVLAALELDDAPRDEAIAAILLREPRHTDAIRRWLASAGVNLGGTVISPRVPPPAPATAPSVDDADNDDETSDPPRRIGPYRIVRLLGRGGFGTVWLGARDGSAAQFAVKVLNPGMDSRDVLRRFAAEREALLRMDHRGIARFVDAGATAAGRPFFVMEYVPGLPLLLHCRKHGLALPDRIHIFLQVLDAVAHAHQKGVIHRDLSGNNVLVAAGAGEPQPKIIDFGVAKSIREPLLEGASLTFQGTLMGTPEYMSPEQAQGQTSAIDTRTDVYSLGVQLYELLADQLPIPGVVLRSQGIAGMAAVIRSHVPARPSQVAPRPLQRALRGDLDWIVMRAIAKDRDDRYASAAEFAADLRRHLAHQPVLASPPSTWYQVRKFARRHWAQVALGTGFLGVLLGTLSFSIAQWRAAGDARQQLQEVHDDLARKASEGFRLLASQQRLRSALAATTALEPPWPERVAPLQQWLRDYGTPLRLQLPTLLRQRDSLAARRATSPGRRLPDPVDEDLLAALDQMALDLQKFCAPDGTIARVEQQLRWAESIAAPALQRDAAAWGEIAAAVRKERGFQLAPQPGLAPLGKNPRTNLFEFLDLASHPPGEPLPQRDSDGGLALRPRTGIVFALLAAGTVRLGAQRDDPGLPQHDPFAADDELRGGAVMLTDFLLAQTELTRSQWALLTGTDLDGDPAMPMTDVDWDEATTALRRFGMQLPTEAQWEYACRAGSTTPWWNGDAATAARVVGNFDGSPQRVAQRPANAFGLFDVHGNVAEWCADWKCDYSLVTVRNGDGLLMLPPPIRLPPGRAVRGGSARDEPSLGRSTARAALPPAARDPQLGLRPARAVRK